MSEQKHNIVLVVMDTARAKNFSSYGYDKQTTPFLSELAEENVLYERAYSQGNFTLASHGSIFSGDYVSEHRVDLSYSFSDLEVFQDELVEKGYDTIGLANITYLSEEFDTNEVFEDFYYNPGPSFFSDLSITREEFHDKDGFKKFFDLTAELLKDFRYDKVSEIAGRKLRKYTFRKDSGAEKTNRMVKDRLSERDSDDPFFLFLNYIEPHTPYLPPFPYSHSFQDNKLCWKSLIDLSDEEKKLPNHEGDIPPESKIRSWEALYDGEISYLDFRLENLYSWIKERYPNTVFIFTSDHGEHFYEKGLTDHGIGLHEEVIRVPLIEVFPENIQKDVKNPVELRKLSDHIKQIADGDCQTIEPQDYVISEAIGFDKDIPKHLQKYTNYNISVIDEDYKLIWYSGGEKELFSMPEEDRMEDSDLENQLTSVIDDRVGNPEEMDLTRKENKIKDEKIKENLENLGYL